MPLINQQVILVNRPKGLPKIEDFKIIETPVPDLKDGEVLLKTLYFSLDPYMRSRMNTTKGSYVESFKLGQVLDGAAVCVVEQSKSNSLKVGEVVLTGTGWQTYPICKGEVTTSMSRGRDTITKIVSEVKASLYLGALGMPGLTAHHGLMEIGQPKAGDVVVVSAATGPVGSMVGQLAQSKGCRVVGIAGGAEKCQYAVREFGFDACVDHKAKTFLKDLRDACPTGIDIYFENVGGPVFKAILPLLNSHARVPICGIITYYNDGATLQEPGFTLSMLFPKLKAFLRLFLHFDHTPMILGTILGKEVKVQGFLVVEHFDAYQAFLKETIPLIQSGKIKAKEDIVKGIENSPAAFIRLLQGKNFGKMVIEI